MIKHTYAQLMPKEVILNPSILVMYIYMTCLGLRYLYIYIYIYIYKAIFKNEKLYASL